MSFLGGQSAQERYYNRPVNDVFTALEQAAQSPGFTLKRADDLSMTVTLTTGVSMTTWGETLTATCHPAGDGTTIQVSAAGRAVATVWQGGRNTKVINKLFDAVTSALQANTN